MDASYPNCDPLNKKESDRIVRHIASFLTVSDAASLMTNEEADGLRSSDSWAVGVDVGFVDPEDVGVETSWEQQLLAPQNPAAFLSLSPGTAAPCFDFSDGHHDYTDEQSYHNPIDCSDDDYDAMQEILWERKRRWVQHMLAAAVFSHPGSVRSFSFQAYTSARGILKERRVKQVSNDKDPETSIEPHSQNNSISIFPHPRRKAKRRKLVSAIVAVLLNNVPLSVFFDVLEAVGEVSLDTSYASFTISCRSMEALVQGTFQILRTIWHHIVSFNPFQLLEAIVSFQFNAMGKTSEVLACGIQSVATGVGSASNLALHRLSAANLSVTTRVTGGVAPSSLRGDVVNENLLRKLAALNDAARVVEYVESEDETGGLT